jgi:BirA family biotin operon repressor/biotin-[acetyl-CoA-carboxylase] ligase
MLKAFALLEHLADGETHSGESIAADLGVSRAAVWNQVKRLQAEGVPVHAVSGKGYRVPGGYEFLSKPAIELDLGEPGRRLLTELTIERSTDSTNQRLLERLDERSIHGLVWLAEYQSAGRGRRGGTWLAPPGSGLCLSLGWRFDAPPSTMSALSLVIGIAVVRALERLGARNVALKWPNDVYHADRKLAGILIEMRSEFGGPCTVAIGIGINTALSKDAHARINELATDVASACGSAPSRNRTAAFVIDEIFAILEEFGDSGFARCLDEWQQRDLLDGRALQLGRPDRIVSGIGRGVALDGTLLIESDGRTQAYLAGHIVMGAPA